VALLQLIVLYVPFLSSFFGLVPLSLCDLSIALAGGVVVFAVLELGKLKHSRAR
jgi:hypothetical protein